MVRVFTVGCAGKDAREFFTILKRVRVRKVVDVRLYNTSQLAGFSKRRDIEYFLQAIVGVGYVHQPIMAPTKRLLNDYKKGLVSWPQYEAEFKEIIAGRQIEKCIESIDIDMACFLCSEAVADRCHRRLVVEYLAGCFQDVLIEHI